MKKQIIIDTDPGVDDALAIAMAFANDKLDIKLISSCAGNMLIDTATRNTLHLVERFNKNIPVAKGSQIPFLAGRPYGLDVVKIHGNSGFGFYKFNEPKIKPVAGEAFEVMYETLKKYPENKTTILCLAPLTNIAKMINSFPDCKKYIDKIVFMGGSRDRFVGYDPMNLNELYPQFNIDYDPFAAEVVFNSGIDLVMVPTEMGHTAFLTNSDVKKIKKQNKTGYMFYEMWKFYNDNHVPRKFGVATHDSAALAYVVYPSLFKVEKANFKVVWFNNNRSATALCDIVPKAKHVVCVDINTEAFKNYIFECLQKFD